MKTAKSYNLLILIAVLITSLICAFSMMGVSSVKAANDPNGFLKTSRSDLSFAYMSDNSIGAQVADGDTVSFTYQLLVDDLGVQLYVENGLSVTVELTAKSFDVNGNKFDNNGTIEYVTDVVTDYTLQNNGEVSLVFGVEDNFITVKENDGAIVKKTQSHFKVENVDKTAVYVKFIFEKADASSATDLYEFKIRAVNQKVSAGYDYATNKFVQTFENNNGSLTKIATPRVVIEKSFFSNTENGYELNKISGNLYSMNLSAYSLVEKPSSSSLYLTRGDIDQYGSYIRFPNETYPKSATFYLKGEHSSEMGINVCKKIDGVETVLENYTVNVVSRDAADNDAPAYRDYADVADLVESFQQKLISETLDPDSVKEGNPHSINLGKTITIPSLENFVIDDISAYSKLTKTYHYITPSQNEKTTSSTKSIALDDAGVYRLYVTYSDENGNSTDSNLFYNVSAIGSNKYVVKIDGNMEEYDSTNPEHVEIFNEATYSIFIFSFTINDDAPLSVAAVAEQENGFINTKYTALDFNIVASGFTTNYTLWYNSSLTADENSNWVQILPLNKVGSAGANGYTYDELKAIGYDGKLTFTPDKIGSYKIECYLTSDKSFREKSDFTILRITDEPVIVQPANYWFQENLVSLIFLGVGTACLIAIIVLLCIKPKETVNEDE